MRNDLIKNVRNRVESLLGEKVTYMTIRAYHTEYDRYLIETVNGVYTLQGKRLRKTKIAGTMSDS